MPVSFLSPAQRDRTPASSHSCATRLRACGAIACSGSARITCATRPCARRTRASSRRKPGSPWRAYFGIGRGVTYYNLVSDQFTGLHGITVPGTLRDSLVLLAVALEQQTELQPTQIMTDTGAYSDVVFGLFRLLGYRFSPRLADIGGTRFWRIDSRADYGPL